MSKPLCRLALSASLATKLADTFASEVGKGFGKTTFLITNFKRVPPGTEGAVSLEGTLASVVGGFLLSGVACLLGLISGWRSLTICGVSAFLATLFESYLGATVQKGWMTNEVVNFVNTSVGAAVALLLAKAFLP